VHLPHVEPATVRELLAMHLYAGQRRVRVRRVHARDPNEWVVYNVTQPNGVMSRDCVIDVQQPQMMHDFATSRNFAIFLDAGLAFNPKAMVREGGLPFTMDTSRPSRIGLVKKPRNGEFEHAAGSSGVWKWFEVAPFFGFHTANAWEEGEHTVCLAMCRYSAAALAALVWVLVHCARRRAARGRACLGQRPRAHHASSITHQASWPSKGILTGWPAHHHLAPRSWSLAYVACAQQFVQRVQG
jgi:Retinal pigment epithelial membrane protein